MPGQRNQRGEPLSLRDAGAALRTGPLFHVVLHEPEIPNNTGNIGRTCVALGAALHLVRPLGFSTDVHALRRAGLDYWPRLLVTEHEDWAQAKHALAIAPAPGSAPGNVPAPGSCEGRRAWAFTTKSRTPVWEGDFRPGDALVFGKETAGLPDSILGEFEGRALALPMVEGERSLNLATAVCAALYEALRQCVARGVVHLDDAGRIRPPCER